MSRKGDEVTDDISPPINVPGDLTVEEVRFCYDLIRTLRRLDLADDDEAKKFLLQVFKRT